MSDDQQIAFPVNRPDDCSAEQPLKDDAACPVQPPKDDAAASASPVQPPKDDAACPLPPPNFETKMSDVVLMSKDDDAASLAPVPNIDDGPASPPKEDASPASPPKEDACHASPPKEDACHASPPKEYASPLSPPEEDANPAPPPMDDIAERACLSPSPMDETVPLESKANGLENADMHDDGLKVKHEIKHETIDLGNDPYFYDDNNKAIPVESPSKVGFDRGLEPDHIIGATELNGKLMFLIAWKNSEVADLLESTVVYNKCPQLAIQFFEARLRYCPNKQRN